jgi:hypothetical protein
MEWERVMTRIADARRIMSLRDGGRVNALVLEPADIFAEN